MDSDALKKVVSDAKVIILDIEGTTSSIDFMRKEVFPYAEKHLKDYIAKNWEEVRKTILLMLEQGLIDPTEKNEVENNQGAFLSLLEHKMKDDRNDPLVKKIQGLVLCDAFKNGDILGHVYPDTVNALERWFHENKQIYTYSTGTKAVQLEFFRNTMYGDKTQYIKDYFDTSIGSKLESEGFRFICNVLKVDANEVVFFSDRPKEICAATKCGLNAILIDRESDFSMIEEEKDFLGYEDGRISSFTEICIDVKEVLL
ncbi:enolase-phosphatase E1 [Caerostris darwini]|uniref:Enolase-phosphatase E1 n=1 Tax=Caerostris darwini TaxID=1538125 RepID=A0AAV4VN90_9ARAC|nr:enolase-phosphatase E1 [Caerostris darwini]